MEALSGYLRRRSESMPHGYPLESAIAIHSMQVIITVSAVAQRGFALPWQTCLAAPLAVSCPLWFLVRGVVLRNIFVLTLTTASAVVLFLWSGHPALDLAPLLLPLMVADVAAMRDRRESLAVAVSCAVFLLAVSQAKPMDGLLLYLCLTCVGWYSGSLVLAQQKLLLAEREMRDRLTEQAATDERRRIAREVHDAIAHSLSVTLLQVTGARLALEQDQDIQDAQSALVDAERLGRQAMADIRRTIGLLRDDQTRLVPEPGVEEIEDLVADFARAGIDVRYRIEGELSHVSSAVGLGLYRIAQESLSNVAKHAPRGTTSIRLTLSATTVTLWVVNKMADPASPAVGQRRGTGLQGMRQRAELLDGSLLVQQKNGHWIVHVRIPLAVGDSAHSDFHLAESAT